MCCHVPVNAMPGYIADAIRTPCFMERAHMSMVLRHCLTDTDTADLLGMQHAQHVPESLISLCNSRMLVQSGNMHSQLLPDAQTHRCTDALTFIGGTSFPSPKIPSSQPAITCLTQSALHLSAYGALKD